MGCDVDLFPLVSVHAQYMYRDSKEDGVGFFRLVSFRALYNVER